jgi:hypothetical protein
LPPTDAKAWGDCSGRPKEMNQAVVRLSALVIASSDLSDQGRSLANAAVSRSRLAWDKADVLSSTNVFDSATKRIDSVVVLPS